MKRSVAIACLALGACSTPNPNLPVALESHHESTGHVANTIVVHVWADQNHRNQISAWRLRFERSITRANRLLEPDLGISLEIKEAKPWNRKEPIADDLNLALAELQETDPADDADIVVGLVSSMPVFIASLDQIGLASTFGRYIVLRGQDDLQELAALSKPDETGDLPEVYRERVLHRETTVLLHEVGHIFGAIHIEDPHTFMNPHWSKDAGRYDDKNTEMMELVIGHRLRARNAKQLDTTALEDIRKLLEANGWEQHDRTDFARVKAAFARGELSEAPRRPAYEEAWHLAQDGHNDEAWSSIARVREVTPDDPTVLDLACSIAVRRKNALADAQEACTAASRVVIDRSRPLLNLAWAYLEANDVEHARPPLAGARAWCKEHACDARTIAFAANLHVDAGALQLAEQLIATASTAEDAKQTSARIADRRTRCGLPAGSAITADHEPDYIRACEDARTALNKRDWKKTLAIAEKTRRALGDTAGLHLFACQAYLVSFAREKAVRECKEAVARWPELSEAHFYLAILASMSGNGREAILHAERVRALEPKREATWALLATEYRHAKETAKLKALEDDFLRIFGRPLNR